MSTSTAQTSDNSKARADRPANVPADRVYEIDMYALKGIEEGYHEAWKRIQTEGIPDLIWTPFHGGHWIATNGTTVQEIYVNPTRFSSQIIFLPKEVGEKYEMVPTRMDPPEHTPYRQALNNGLGLAQIRKIESKVRSVAKDLIAGFTPRGACDFSIEYARIFPVKVFMALADLPMEDAPTLGGFAEMMMRPRGNSSAEMAQVLDQGNRGFFAYVEPIIRARQGKSGDDLLSVVVNSQVNGRPIERQKALGLISLLLLAGLDTVVNFLSFAMIHLARHPEIVSELRSDHMKLLRGVEEMFRRFPVVSEARMVAHDQDFRGMHLKHGDMILVPTALHGLDAAANDDPLRLDLSRRKISHSTFGDGPHRCAGMHLARLEVTVTLEEWLQHIPTFKLKEGARPIYHSGIIAAVENVPLVWPHAKQN
jgi:camphor 5-monooxygenase